MDNLLLHATLKLYSPTIKVPGNTHILIFTSTRTIELQKDNVKIRIFPRDGINRWYLLNSFSHCLLKWNSNIQHNLDLHYYFFQICCFIQNFLCGFSILVYYGGKLWQDLSKYKKVRMLSAKSTYIFYILDFPIDSNRVTQIYAL